MEYEQRTKDDRRYSEVPGSWTLLHADTKYASSVDSYDGKRLDVAPTAASTHLSYEISTNILLGSIVPRKCNCWVDIERAFRAALDSL